MGIMGINPDRMSLINYLGVSEPVGTWCIGPTGLAMLKFRSAGNINKKKVSVLLSDNCECCMFNKTTVPILNNIADDCRSGLYGPLFIQLSCKETGTHQQSNYCHSN